MRILGVDPGTRSLGYAIVDCGRAFRYVECGVLKADTTEAMATRVHAIVAELGDIIEEFKPAVLAIEKAFYGRNAASALKLGQARGAVMMLAGQRAVPVLSTRPRP